jgi:hypothetical protein
MSPRRATGCCSAHHGDRVGDECGGQHHMQAVVGAGVKVGELGTGEEGVIW